MIQENMRFHAAFGAAERGSGKQRRAQRDGGGIHREKLVLEAELVALAAESLLLPEPCQCCPEQVLEHGGGPMFVGVGKRRAPRRFLDAQMYQTALAAGQAIADLPQGVGAAELAEQHRGALRPTGEALGGPFGTVFLHQ